MTASNSTQKLFTTGQLVGIITLGVVVACVSIFWILSQSGLLAAAANTSIF